MQRTTAAPSRGSPLDAAASTRVGRLLDGPVRRLRPVGASRTGLHLATDDADVPVLAVTAAGGVRLPAGVQLAVPPEGLPEAVADGGGAVCGGGSLHLGRSPVRVTRWWSPPRPVLAAPRTARVRAALLALRLPPLEAPVATALRRFRATGDVAGLVGLGSGLTPAGDDVLAGMLLTLRALERGGRTGAGRLADAVEARVPTGRTTAFSAALLRDAAHGWCVPELADLVAALDGRGDLDTSAVRLIRLGHSSGVALAHGAVFALSPTVRGRWSW